MAIGKQNIFKVVLIFNCIGTLKKKNQKQQQKKPPAMSPADSTAWKHPSEDALWTASVVS